MILSTSWQASAWFHPFFFASSTSKMDIELF
jgi:hypothetical protein